MPATPDMVIGFIAYLFDNGRAGATITSYISAVAYFHKIQGYTDPTTSFLVRKLLVGARALARKGDERLPITTTVLNKLCDMIHLVIADSYKCKLIKAMFLLAFHGLLRIGELTVKSSDQKHTLHLADIQFIRNKVTQSYSHLVITFRSFKHSNSHKTVLKIKATTTNCPVKSLFEFAKVRPEVDGPLFIFSDKCFLSASYFWKYSMCMQFYVQELLYYKL